MMNSLILSLKILLIASGAVSLALAMKSTVPLFVNSASVIWAEALSWLKPPYLYVIINGIIITIAASSRFHSKQDDHTSLKEPLISVRTPPAAEIVANVVGMQREPPLVVYYESEEKEPLAGTEAVVDKAVFEVMEPPPTVAYYESEEKVVEVMPILMNGREVEIGEDDENEVQNHQEIEDEDEIHLDSASTLTHMTPPQTVTSPEVAAELLLQPAMEKPLVSSRFGHRKPLKASPEGGRSLRVARPRRQETLESTWKMITEGRQRHVPLTRHQKRSDIWDNHGRNVNASTLDENENHHSNDYHQLHQQNVSSLEILKDRTNSGSTPSPVSASPRSGKIKKEPSLGQDELHRRVEAFIRKFNEEMRLQRQQSLQQYMEMINRGAN